MSVPLGIDWRVLIGAAIVIITLIRGIWKLATWKVLLDTKIDVLTVDVAAIKEDLRRRGTGENMPTMSHSPLVPVQKARNILEDLSIISQVGANIHYIREEIEKRSEISIYQDIKDPEERYIEFAPGVIHGLIKRGKIDAKKIDAALNELEVFFPAVTYYGVLLLITAYILEKYVRKKPD